MDIRPYSPADLTACLAVFDSNSPQFFDPALRPEFETFLGRAGVRYFVMDHDGAIVGCGGFDAGEGESLANLRWGMIRGDLHRRGLGRFLLMFRLREVTKLNGVQMVRVETPPLSAPFFDKQGFKVVTARAERVEMLKKLSVCP